MTLSDLLSGTQRLGASRGPLLALLSPQVWEHILASDPVHAGMSHADALPPACPCHLGKETELGGI